MDIKNIKADEGSIKEQVLKDADGDIQYIKDVAEHGCIGGSCRNLIYYTDTHAFYDKHAEEIDELLERLDSEGVYQIIDIRKTNGDLRNYLAWLAYEVNAQEIIRELDEQK